MKQIVYKIFILISISICFNFSFAEISRPQASMPIRVLLIPGHDDEVWGAQYKNIKEAAMNLAVAKRLHAILAKDNRFEVYITRDSTGYVKEFSDYFKNKEDEIISFKENARIEMQNKINNGDFIQKEGVPHNDASKDVAIKLYGFNKWANENGVDAMIQIHFNDYHRPQNWAMGKYKGFVIYMPDGELSNWKESSKLAGDVFMQLSKKYTTSTYKKELGGLVPDQKLIALGANGTLLPSVRSILIEYGYIYSLGNSVARHRAYDNMASLTAVGIKNYFFNK